MPFLRTIDPGEPDLAPGVRCVQEDRGVDDADYSTREFLAPAIRGSNSSRKRLVTRCVPENITKPGVLCEGRDQALHPRNQERGGLQLKGLGFDHTQQDVLRHVTEADLVVPAVQRQQPGYVGQLILGGMFDEAVGEAVVVGEIVQLCHRPRPQSRCHPGGTIAEPRGRAGSQETDPLRRKRTLPLDASGAG